MLTGVQLHTVYLQSSNISEKKYHKIMIHLQIQMYFLQILQNYMRQYFISLSYVMYFQSSPEHAILLLLNKITKKYKEIYDK